MKKLFTKLTLAVAAISLMASVRSYAEDVWQSKSLKIVSQTSVAGDASQGEFVIDATLTNIGNKKINVKYGFEMVDLTDGQQASFCWGVCYAQQKADWPSSNLWQDKGGPLIPGTLDPDQTTSPNEISFHMYASNYDFDKQDFVITPGTSKIRYFFYNADDPSDSVSIVVTFTANPTAVADEQQSDIEFDLLGVSPNPAPYNNATVHFNLPENTYDVPYLEVWDSRGSRVLREDLCGCAHDKDLDISKLPNGSYYLNLICDGKKTKSKTLIISR